MSNPAVSHGSLSRSFNPTRQRERDNPPAATAVCVRNLSPRTTETHIRRFFSEMGEVVAISLVHEDAGGRPQGTAVVEFAHERGAALSTMVFDGRKLHGRVLRVSRLPVSEPRVRPKVATRRVGGR